MAAAIHPKFSMSYAWALGEDGWNSGMDDNLRDMALFTQLIVDAITNAAPASPANGETHIVGLTPSGAFGGHANEIAIYLDAAWVFYAPIQGYNATNKADNNIYIYSGSAWAAFAPVGSGDMLKSVYDTGDTGVVDSATEIDGIDVAQNNQYYGKDNSGAKGFFNLPTGLIPDGAIDGEVPLWNDTLQTYVPTTLTNNLRIALSAVGVLNDAETIAIYNCVDAFTLPASLAGSSGYARVQPTENTTIDIQKNGASIGSIDFTIGSNIATFSFINPVTFTIGDRINFVVPDPADLTLADVSATLRANF